MFISSYTVHNFSMEHTQQVVGDVTIWYQSLVRVFYGVAWPDLGGWGCYKLVFEAKFTEKNHVRNDLNFELQSIHECQEGIKSTP
jgi:hypothetical protein